MGKPNQNSWQNNLRSKMKNKLILVFLLMLGTAWAGDCREFTLTQSGLICSENPHKLRDQILANAFMITASVFDCKTTVDAVKSGATEINPLMRPFSKNFASCMGFKSAVMIPVGIIGWKRDIVKGQIIIGSTAAGFAVWNSFQF